MRRWSHGHSWIAGALAGGALVQRHGWALLAVGFLAGLAVAWAFRTGWRIAHRLDRALPDAGRGHPCAGPECNAVVYSRNRYCSETCRELAAEERMRRRLHAERLADYGEVPY